VLELAIRLDDRRRVHAQRSRQRAHGGQGIARRELERDGVVDMRQGSGTFIATLSPEARGHTREQEARRLVRELLEQAARLAICPLDLRRAIDAELGTRS